LILDEVQILEGIYMNGEVKRRHLLTEFFNFLVRLTKETHLAHVVVMTSETLFLEKIYNHSKLAETSDFYLIGHLDFKQVQEWLKHEGIEDKEIVNLIWEYVGGGAHRINDAIRIVKKGDSLEHYLLDEAKIYRGKISHFIAKTLKNTDARKKFRLILKKLVQDGFVIRNNDDDLETEVLDLAIEYEFLFLNPREERIVFNSQIVRKGAELLVEG
jgi:AAA+ ATPase superfamily predicted ATPase